MKPSTHVMRALAMRLAIVTLLTVLATGTFGLRLQGAGVSEADLRALVYGDSVPGFHEIAAVPGGHGPEIELDRVQADGAGASRIRANWRSIDELNWLEINLSVFASQHAALEAAKHQMVSQ